MYLTFQHLIDKNGGLVEIIQGTECLVNILNLALY